MSERIVPSAKWRWDDLFSVDVPDNWTVNEQDGVVEITPGRAVGALHITFLRRAGREKARPGEAALLLQQFAEGRNGTAVVGDERRRGDVRVAMGSMSERPEQGSTLEWDLQAQVWSNGALVSTYCHDGKHPIEREEALMVLSSLRPES